MANEPGEPNDNVLDLRVARWRHDPFMAEMLEIIEKLSRYSEEEKGGLDTHEDLSAGR